MLRARSLFRNGTVLLAGAAMLGGLTAARPAFHLHLVKSAPPSNATVSASPDSIRLWFSQAPELAVTSVRVTRADSKAIALAPLARGDSGLVVVPVKARMSPGSYTVAWRTMAKDGHVARGTFSFRIQAPPR
jgi:methionine-rich copper-binding protein CopC